MKLYLIFFLCIAYFGIYAQRTNPVSFISNFEYGETQGVTGSNYLNAIQQRDGSVLIKPYNSMYRRLTNTGTRFIAADSAAIANSSSLISIKSDTYLCHQNGVCIFRNDSIITVYSTHINYNFPVGLPNNGVIITDRKIQGKPNLFFLSPVGLKKLQFPANDSFDSASITIDSYTRLPVLMQCYVKPKNNFYIYNPAKKTFEFLCTYLCNNSYGYSAAVVFGKDSAYFVNGNGKWMRTPTGKSRNLGNYLINNGGSNYINLQHTHYTSIEGIGSKRHTDYTIDITTRLQTIGEDSFYNSLYVGTLHKLHRIFPHVKKYPAVYNSSNSNATHFITQSKDGTVYFGNYAGFLSSYKNGALKNIDIGNTPLLPGGTVIDEALYSFAEKSVGLFKIDNNILAPVNAYGVTGFFIAQSRDKQKIFTGNAGYKGIGIILKKDLQKNNYNWRYVDSAKGITLTNVLSLTEDEYGRLWFGRASQGWGVYYPEKDSATTFLKEKNETEFGFISSIIDNNGFVWMGGNNGLWYADTKKKGTINATYAARFVHPLLPDKKSINSLKLWNNYLLIGIDKNLLALPLNIFHHAKDKDFLNVPVRYINPQELPLTAPCEQNTMLVDNIDSTVWLATSENIYNIDIKKWLSLPVYAAAPAITVYSNKDSVSSSSGTIYFGPTQNSLQFQINYQTKDNMPRYLQTALIAAGDSVIWSNPTLNNTYTAANLQNGTYIFWVRILQQNGTITKHKFTIVIKKFIWQQWWFWALLSTAVIGVAFFLFNLKRKREVAEQKVKTKEAELLTYKKEQEKQLANLQLLTLSSQFRPHFILNALNTIGAQMDDKPEAESVLSRLGESVNLIFNHSRQQKILHPFINEWRLVQNLIHIHRLMYLKNLETTLPNNTTIEKLKQVQVPLGILQIPVENALLHGLSNKEKGPWQLKIDIKEEDDFVQIIITDNGVGRKKSAQLSNFTKHGTGTKNSEDMIAIINQQQQKKISIQYTDDVYELETIKYGTAVTIFVPKNLIDNNG